MSKKIYLIIGIVIFIIVICGSYIQLNTSIAMSSNNEDKEQEILEDIIYEGQLPIPIENLIKVTSHYGYRAPVYNDAGVQISGGKLHSGIDLVGKKDSKIICVKDGEVIHSGWNNSYGYSVEIKHINDDGTEFYTLYAHMQENSLRVKRGENVKEGQVIGIQGTTGNSTGDHLHFEIRTNTGSNRYAVDPAPYLFSKKGE